MSLEVYNQIMSNMLNQRRALAKLRTELEERESRICRKCGRFGHLVWKCRGREKEKKVVRENRFEVLKSRVMQCGVREVRRQEVVRGSEMLWMWARRAQEVGVSTKERKERRGSGTTMRSMGEGEEAQWSKRITPKGGSDVYGRVDNTQRGGDFCEV